MTLVLALLAAEHDDDKNEHEEIVAVAVAGVVVGVDDRNHLQWERQRWIERVVKKQMVQQHVSWCWSCCWPS